MTFELVERRGSDFLHRPAPAGMNVSDDPVSDDRDGKTVGDLDGQRHALIAAPECIAGVALLPLHRFRRFADRRTVNLDAGVESGIDAEPVPDERSNGLDALVVQAAVDVSRCVEEVVAL